MAMPDFSEEIKKYKGTSLQGTTLRLVPFTTKYLYLPQYLEWLRDPEVVRYIYRPAYLMQPVSFSEVKEYVESAINSTTLLFMTIETLPEKKFIGTFKIGPIDWWAKNVNLGIMIGDKSYWGKGLAQEAFSLAIKFCFEEMKMHKVWGGCMGANIGMQRVFEKLGFKKEGCFRDSDFQEGQYFNHLYYGLLKNEYHQLEDKK
ncbi:MAG: GNAT family protein [Nanoarchaeota archaeon]